MITGREEHRVFRVGWLRAAVLGANDGILSVASLLLGVSSAQAGRKGVLVAGLAALVAGAISMAAGEYVSVHSQADTERADLAMEREELASDPFGEERELASIYVERGLDRALAMEVAKQLMAHDALAAHARDELGISEAFTAHPIQAALSSAASFGVGAAMPLMVAVIAPTNHFNLCVAFASLLFLAILGALSAKAGGASLLQGSLRVTFWGAAAMVVTSTVGKVFGSRF